MEGQAWLWSGTATDDAPSGDLDDRLIEGLWRLCDRAAERDPRVREVAVPPRLVELRRAHPLRDRRRYRLQTHPLVADKFVQSGSLQGHGNLGADGSVAYLFAQAGSLSYAPGASEDKIMEAAIEAGASDIVTDADGYMTQIIEKPREPISRRRERRPGARWPAPASRTSQTTGSAPRARRLPAFSGERVIPATV